MADARTEPSMEEILASIKRIIADDGGPQAGGPPRATPRHDPPAFKPEPVLELTEPVALTAEPAPAAPPVATGPAATPPPPPSPAPPGHVAPGLVSDGATCASRQSLSALTSAVARPPAETTVDGLVRELLRPMLKEWLDAHLPTIVESLVAREIARITTPEG